MVEDTGKVAASAFAAGQEVEFKVRARRNKLLGLWVAELLGKIGPDAEDYAKSVVVSDFEEPGEEDVFRKVVADLTAGRADIPESEVRAKMSELLLEAKGQVGGEKP